MTPVIGETVLFTFDAIRRAEIHAPLTPINTLGQGTTVPATIVAVWGDECVNLRVHPDGPGPDLWETSVTKLNETNEDCAHWAFPTTQ